MLVLLSFTDSTTRGTNEMTSGWNYKNQNSSYRPGVNFRGNFDEGKGNLVGVIRISRVKMTEKRGMGLNSSLAGSSS